VGFNIKGSYPVAVSNGDKHLDSWKMLALINFIGTSQLLRKDIFSILQFFKVKKLTPFSL
jgi:hypothetical protein